MGIDVEKLARELAKEFYDDDIWDDLPQLIRSNWVHVAKRALALAKGVE